MTATKPEAADGLHFTLDFTPGPDAEAVLAEWRAEAEREWPALLSRILEQSRMSGLEVVYDLSRLDCEWSPAYRYGQDQPVAWIRTRTGERSDGPEPPAPL